MRGLRDQPSVLNKLSGYRIGNAIGNPGSLCAKWRENTNRTAVSAPFQILDGGQNRIRFGLPARPDVPLCDTVAPLDGPPPPTMGSTDVGDVSWVVPTVQARGATCAVGTPGHSWQMTAQGKSPAAHKGMVHVAKVMAATAIDVIGDADLLAAARADHAGRIGATPYRCPVAADVPPALDMALGR